MKILKLFRPSLKTAALESWYYAKGLTWHNAIGYAVMEFPVCYICGRQRDFIFNFTKLIPVFDEYLREVKYVCTDHGGEWWDCSRGEKHSFVTRPYWYRSIRNSLQGVIINLVILPRFIWFYFCAIFTWYVMFYFYYLLKERR